ncbi:src kinase-associated phosphoprotein 1 [Denticeps clupeoides]|uniref:Src kinase-associated phosphoprotein 1 n=1 Tax=Denticeps clupeoides TaxID=299321 RepID=A0AAY4DD58_9TELE|nr:src kinase-associated phosphoprotein 1-like [Denticeps clupeoides]
MVSVSEDIRRLLEDCEYFVSSILHSEKLSSHASETRKILLQNFRVVHLRNPQEFPFRSDSGHEDSSDDNQSPSIGHSAASDDLSIASDCQEEGAAENFEEIPRVAVQDLGSILKQGYLEKKRRDHSFLRMEWQRRWCVLKNTIFYYFGSEKDKQQKGSFYINGYKAELVPNLRKDSKKNACFELSAPGRRSYQFTASSPREAREWVDQINFVLKDLSSSFIPVDDDEEEEVDEEEETYDDVDHVATPPPPPPPPPPASALMSASSASPATTPLTVAPPEDMEEWDGDVEEDIYEELPEDDFSEAGEDASESSLKAAGSPDYTNYYQGLWDCEAEYQDELSFQRGDVIYIISKEYNIYGWWVGELDGSIGIVPKEFLHPAYII